MKTIIARLIGFYLNVLALVAPRVAGKKGFYIFCTPFRPPLKPHQRKFLETAEWSTFDHPHGMVQVYTWGNGPKKILFLHGWQSHTFRWKNYLDAFSKEEYTLYAFDAPGHGLSGGKYLNLPMYRDVIQKFLQAYPVDAIVSHSLGSFAAIYALSESPHPSLTKLVITGIPGEVKEFVAFYRHVLGLSDRAVDAIRQAFADIIFHLPEYYSAAKFAKTLDVPGLIIHDELDDEAPYVHGVALNRVWKNSILATTSGLGHNLRSATVVRQVASFVTEKAEEFTPVA